MKGRLEIPKLFEGGWDHLVILTYGADLAFFENALWRQIPNRCKNKVILADGRHYLQAYQDIERNGLARYLNSQYVFDGIFTPYAAHAKMILLTNPEEGRLLVGSGNLGMQGYASGGELFTHYEYNKKSSDTLSAFISARTFLERLIDINSIRPVAVRHLRYVFKKTPWLYHSPSIDHPPIRHNLDTSFLQQLKEAVGNEMVEEVTILSPFYDPSLHALEELITLLSPKQIKLLVQPGLTSVNPKLLKRIMNKYPGKIQVHPILDSTEYADAYIHAKLYLVKTRKQVFCLQGSPNLSQVAMLRTFGQGNLELANLLISDDRKGFMELLENLDIQAATSNLGLLELEYRGGERPIETGEADFTLLGVEWDGQYLIVHYTGKLPENPSVGIGDVKIPTDVIDREQGILKLEVSVEYRELLGSALPVYITSDDEEELRSNPVYAWNQKKLDSLLEITGQDVPWTATGDLNLDDEELENLLIDLDANLILDRRSIWRVVQKEIPQTIDDDDEVLRLTYTDIDYEQLHHHPKLQQYRQNASGISGSAYDRVPLQMLLSSILEHFRSIRDISYGEKNIAHLLGTASVEGNTLETEEETAEEITKQQNIQLAAQRRIRRILKYFVQRFLKGLRSRDFQDLVGPEVLIKNYVIFSHILWRLFHREEVEHVFLAESLIHIWKLFWGTDEKDGIYQRMDPEFQLQAIQFIRGHKSDAQMLASMYYCFEILDHQDNQETIFELRNVVRRVLEHDLIPKTTATLEATWIFLGNLLLYNPPTPSRIIAQIGLLTSLETPRGFLESLEREIGASKNGCTIKQQVVYRESLKRQVSVDTLVIKDQALILTTELAIRIVRYWQSLYSKDYYRIATGDGQRIFQYEVEQKKGSLYIKTPSQFDEVGEIPKVASGVWRSSIDDLRTVAQILDRQESIVRTKHKSAMEMK